MRLGVMNFTHHMLNVESICSSAVMATLDSECQLILSLTETDHTVLLIDKYWLQAAILVMSSSETTVRQLQCESTDETLVLASCLGADSVIRRGIAHAKSAVMVSTGMKRHGRSFNDNPKCAEREAGFSERLCKSGGAPSLVEPVACPVLLRSCLGVDAQQIVATDPDSIVRRNPCPFTGLISVCRDDGVCYVCTLLLNLALFNLKVVINKRALNVFSCSSTLESLHYLRVWRVCTLECCADDFENEQVLLEYRGEFWFLLVSWISCNVQFNTSLRDHFGGIYLGMNVSADVCDEVVSRSLMSKSGAFLPKLTSVKMLKHLRGVKAFVSFLACSLKANPSCVSLGEMLDIGVLDPAKLSQSEDKNDCVELVSRGHEADGVWVGHNQVLDRTMSAMAKILLDPVNGKPISDIDGQSNIDDVANGVFLRKVNVSAVPLLRTSYPQLQSNSKRSDVQSCVNECARVVRHRVTQRATRICRYFLCSSLFRVGGKIKSLLVACGVSYGFLDLDCDSHSIDKNANTLRKSKTIIWKVPMSVFETKTFVTGTKSIIGLEPAKQAAEKHRSDLLADSERNVDLKRFSPAEIAGVARRFLVIGPKRSEFNELHEDAEIAIVVKRLKTVK